MSTKYDRLCRATRTAPTVERIDYPLQDWFQDAWLQGLTTLVKQGRSIKNATTTDELYTTFYQDAGLLTTCLDRAVVKHVRETKGQTPKQQALLARMFSLDSDDSDGTAYAEIIEDLSAELPFRFIEDFDLIVNHPELKQKTPAQQAAIKRFVVAWAMQEAGYTIPNNVRQRLLRDRKLTGLPLTLKRGPRTKRV